MTDTVSHCIARGFLGFALACAACAGTPAGRSLDPAPRDDGSAAPAIEASSRGLREVRSAFVRSLVFLETAVDARPDFYSFLLDTGAPYSAIDEVLVSELGLEASLVRSPDDKLPRYLAVATLEVGGERCEIPRLYSVAMTQFSNAAGLRIGGILGNDFLRSHTVRIDYEARRVEIGEASAYSHDGRGVVLPVSPVDYVYLMVTAMPDDGEEYGLVAMLDSGFNGPVQLCDEFVEELELTRSPAGLLTSLVGEKRADTVRLAVFRLGGFSFEGCTVVTEMDIPTGVGASIGSELLSRFTVTFDFARRRVILEPGPSLRDPLGRRGLGFGVTTLGPPYDCFVVHGLTPERPGSRAGLQEGDQILMVDGRSAVDLGMEGIFDAIRHAERENVPLILWIWRDGSRLRIRVHPETEASAKASSE